MAMTYRKAGVDVKKAERLVSFLEGRVQIDSGFGGLFPVPKGYRSPILVSSTDGVGTKLKIASLCGRYDTVGIDLVAMNVNDILCRGAKPLFFLDYIATGKLDLRISKAILSGIIKGCEEADCKLIGGETAEMPGFYPQGEYELAGFCVGIVEKSRLLPKTDKIKEGDVVIGLASSGLHSNGFSLVRKVFKEEELKKRSKELLTPTRIYVRDVLRLLEKGCPIKQIAHITGGGFPLKAVKGLPNGLTLRIERGSWPIPELFLEIKKRAGLSDWEAFSTFNMGIGLILIVEPRNVDSIIRKISSYPAWVIGEVVRGKKLLLRG